MQAIYKLHVWGNSCLVEQNVSNIKKDDVDYSGITVIELLVRQLHCKGTETDNIFRVHFDISWGPSDTEKWWFPRLMLE